jgi:hypothetical protein
VFLYNLEQKPNKDEALKAPRGE